MRLFHSAIKGTLLLKNSESPKNMILRDRCRPENLDFSKTYRVTT